MVAAKGFEPLLLRKKLTFLKRVCLPVAPRRQKVGLSKNKKRPHRNPGRPSENGSQYPIYTQVPPSPIKIEDNSE